MDRQWLMDLARDRLDDTGLPYTDKDVKRKYWELLQKNRLINKRR